MPFPGVKYEISWIETVHVFIYANTGTLYKIIIVKSGCLYASDERETALSVTEAWRLKSSFWNEVVDYTSQNKGKRDSESEGESDVPEDVHFQLFPQDVDVRYVREYARLLNWWRG